MLALYRSLLRLYPRDYFHDTPERWNGSFARRKKRLADTPSRDERCSVPAKSLAH